MSRSMPRCGIGEGTAAWAGVILATGCLALSGNTLRAGDTAEADRFATECAAMAATAEKAEKIAVPGRDGWLFLAAELRHIGAGAFWGADASRVSRAVKPEWADPLPAIVDFKRQLDRAGISLLLVPVLPKVIVYPEMLPGGVAADGDGSAVGPRLDPPHQAFCRLLAENGVAVLDLTDAFIEARAAEGEGRLLYCRTDTHWSPYACELAARLIRQEIGEATWLPTGPNPFQSERRTLNITGDLARSVPGGGEEALQARIVAPSGNVPAVTETVSRDSPVLLLGDSHCLVFHSGGDMLATGAGLADQLAVELGVPVDLLGVRGSGATPARISLMRRVRGDATYLPRKKLVIWCFAAREFTQSEGWRNVPILKAK